MKTFLKTVAAIAAQGAVAWALVAFVVGPMMRGEPLPWQSDPSDEAETGKMEALGPLLPLDEILVNVAGTKGRRFFKTSMTLELEDRDLEKTASARMPLLRGKVIDLLATKTMDELVEPSARDSLRSEILDTLNAEVSGGKFSNVFFTEFLVQ